MGVAHVALELSPRHQRRHRVDRHDVDRAAADQRLADLQRLLARVRLRDEELVDVDAAVAGVDRIERVLGVDQRGDAARALASAMMCWTIVVLPDDSGP